MKHFIFIPLVALALWGSGCASTQTESGSVGRTPTDELEASSHLEDAKTIQAEESVKRVHRTDVIVD